MPKVSNTMSAKVNRPAHVEESSQRWVNQPASLDPNAGILALQRAAGNRAVSRLLQSQVGRAPAGDVPTIRHRSRFGVQAKLAVSHPNDRYEQEADRVADQVMRMRVPGTPLRTLSIESSPITRLQRKCVGCEEEDSRAKPQGKPEGTRPLDIDMPTAGGGPREEEPVPIEAAPFGRWLQRACAQPEKEKRVRASETPGPAVNGSVGHLSPQGGQPLSSSVRGFFEPRFGYAFDRVRVHTDARATNSARAVNALAYTQGHNIVFGAGQYAPETAAGRRLLAHELTHVMQQNSTHGPTHSSESQNRSVPVQATPSGETILQRKWVTGDPIAGINTIVCDGKGGISVQLSGKEDAVHAECLNDCMTKHELSHKEDAVAANAKICDGQGANRIVTVDTDAERKATETKASNAEIDCLKAKPETAKCKTIIKDRIKQMEAYRDKFK